MDSDNPVKIMMKNVMSRNSYTYEYFTQDYVCRICWSENGVIELSSYTNKNEAKLLTIAEKISDCIGINVALNSFPSKICKKCLNKIEAFILFKDLFCEKERYLSETLQIGPIEIEIEEPKKETNELAESDDLLSDSNVEIIDYEHTGSSEVILKEKSKNNTNNSCIFCKKDFLTKLKLEDHYSKIHGVKYDTLFQKYEGLNEETLEIKKKRIVRKKTPTYCIICKIDFHTKDKIVEHNSEVHHIIDELFQCFGCEKKYELRNHRFRHEKFYCKFLKQGFLCKTCDRLLPSRKIWEQHYIAHKNNKKIFVPENLFKCRICEKEFKCMQTLNDHRKLHKPKLDKSLKYVCEECGKAFTRRDYFNKHKLSHNGLKPHQCPHCDFKAVQKTTLNVHLRRHTGERPYACVMCDKRFTTSSNLLKHNTQHLGLKRFGCQVCEKKFSYKQSLDEHEASVHQRSVTYSCELCPTSFVTFRGLKRHYVKKHNKKVDKKSFKFT